MSGHQAFLSFVNHLQATLTGEINVYTEKGDHRQPPYLWIYEGATIVHNRWLSETFAHSWLIIPKTNVEPLTVSAGKKLDLVLSAGRDVGSLEKFDYAQTPTKSDGLYIPRVEDITADRSDDPQMSKRLINWILATSG